MSENIDKIINKDGDVTPEDISKLNEEEQRQLVQDSGLQQTTEELMEQHLEGVPDEWGIING